MSKHEQTVGAESMRRDAPESVGDTADSVGRALGSVETAAAAVQSNVASGIQPDIRDIRGLVADLRDTVSIAFRRIFYLVIACIAVNVVTLVVVLTR
jgi:hypothetical protein